MSQWYISTYVESYVELVANSTSTIKPQCTGLVHARVATVRTVHLECIRGFEVCLRLQPALS
jgi:hypothetical protein